VVVPGTLPRRGSRRGWACGIGPRDHGPIKGGEMSWCEGFPPLLAPGARVLILGSMPGAASLRAQAYYAHPRNAFWPIMGALYGFEPAAPYDVRCAALTSAGVAVWDVLQACERPGSLDAAIVADSRVANDFSGLFAQQPTIRRILFNGATA